MGTVLDADGVGSTVGLLNGLNWAAERGASVVSMSITIDFAAMVDILLNQGYPTGVATSAAIAAHAQCLRQIEAAADYYSLPGVPVGRCWRSQPSGTKVSVTLIRDS